MAGWVLVVECVRRAGGEWIDGCEVWVVVWGGVVPVGLGIRLAVARSGGLEWVNW